ncbi:MAG: MiaB/RimO family radical SAM methylthiotransferase [Chromatiales bacterium]|nr:MiaB/RimO family radical SAM methylthiotransferase [Chromatiales bacterium]
MKFFIRTLGCKMNWLDSARLGAALQSAGHHQVADEAAADHVFVNTCTVTAEAERKSRQTVKQVQQLVPQVVVMGCSPRVEGNHWQREQGRLVFADQAALFAQFGIETDEERLPLQSRTRLPVAIQTGCDNICSFCITRIARGAHRNLPAPTIIQQIRLAEEHGIQEVILTGINLAAWGCENSRQPEQARLHELLEQILEQTTIPRIRISSIGPQFIQPGFWDVYADPRICDHLHISLQSGSPEVLARMVREHGTDEVAWMAEQARQRRPNTALVADIICGFPGETEAQHRQGLRFLDDCGFARLHVFPYSSREGTAAADYPEQVEVQRKKARAADVRQLSRQLHQRFLQQQLGKEVSVLLESSGQQGLSSNYIRVNVPDGQMGEIRRLRLDTDNLAESLDNDKLT